MADDGGLEVHDSEVIKRIETLADSILEDRLPILVPGDVQAVISEIQSALDQVEPEAIPPAWFFAKAASSACTDFITRFGVASDFWQPWLSEIRNLAVGIKTNPWSDEEQGRVLAQCIPFYRNVSGDGHLGRYSEMNREPLFPALTEVLEDRYARIGTFAIVDEITDSAIYDKVPEKDSLCSLLLLESEVRVYGRVFLGGGADVVNEKAQTHTRHLVYLLGSLTAAVVGRHALAVRQRHPLPVAWYDVERRLRSAFIRLIQRTPLRDSSVPNQGTHAYARSGTHAANVVRKRYQEMFFDTLNDKTQLHILPVSSGMAAVSLAVSALIAEKAATDQPPAAANAPLKVCSVGWAYHETLNLLRRLLRGHVEYESVALDRIDELATTPDVFFLEPFSNYLKAPGQALNARSVVSKIANIEKPIAIIVDKTTDPFCLDKIDAVLTEESLLVSVESVIKYLQYGDAIALGGVISLIAKPGSKAAERAQALQHTIKQYAELQGQHMDPRLAWSLAPTRELLSWRLERMRRNALMIAGKLRHTKIGKLFHAVIDDKPSTLIYIRFKLAKEHTQDMVHMLRMFEEHARKLVHKWIGDPSYEKTFGKKDFPRELFYKYVSHQTPLRLSTSFGFSTTTMMFLRMDKTIWARVSVGCESLPALDQMYRELLVPILLDVNRLT